MDELRAKELLKKYRAGKATEVEQALVETFYLNYGQNEMPGLSENQIEQAVDRVLAKLPQKEIKQVKIWPRIAVAASVLLCLFTGGYFILHKKPSQQISQIQKHDISPGSNKAILTLAGGKKIILTGVKNGKLAEQGVAVIKETQNGQIVYIATAAVTTSTAVTYNTIETPRGGQYHVVLADGTNVWLNAASSLKYPIAFAGDDRTVELSGEAYFEVTHNKEKPFRVKSNGQTVEVLGTHFNINAYSDEPVITTTLLEGKVGVTKGKNHVIIVPGEEAVATDHTDKLKINPADLEKAVAWKNGEFVFNGDNIAPIMRQIARWYDADIIYQTSAAHKNFVGSVSRFSNVSEVLKTMELTQTVHFKVEGRRITVMQ